MIVRVNVVLNRTVVVDSDVSTTYAVVIFEVTLLYVFFFRPWDVSL